MTPMSVPPGLMPGVLGVTPVSVPPGLIPGVVGVTPMSVPPGLIPGMVGVTPMRVPPGLIPGVVGVPPALPGLVPGPPGPNPGEVGELEVAGEFDVPWGELLSPPPHPVITIDAHKIQRQPRVDNHLAMTALDEVNAPACSHEGMKTAGNYALAASLEVTEIAPSAIE